MLRKTRRIAIPLAIVLFWAIMMGWLIQREVIAPALNPAPRTARSVVPQDIWMGISLDGGSRIGFLNSRSQPGARGADTGARLGITTKLVMNLFGRDTELWLDGSAWISNKHGLTDFEFNMRSGGQGSKISGAILDGRLSAQLQTAGETIPFTYPIQKEVLLSTGMGMPSMNALLLEPGKEAYVETFDPTTMSLGRARIACEKMETLSVGGTDYETFLMTTTIGGITSKAWVTRDETVVRAETAFGFILEIIDPDEALEPIHTDEKASLIQRFLIQPTGKTPVEGAKTMSIRLSGVSEDRMPPSDPLQERTDSGYLLRMPAPPANSAIILDEDQRSEYLGSDAIVTANHEKIIAAAREIAAGSTDPWEQARRINAWLFENIEKISVITIPTALDVLRTKQGDCNEHTVLFAALARALGIPTRIAVGLVWSAELAGFGYHAWPEVHIGGAWIPMDPTFGQPLADATHLKLLNGGIDQWTRLLPYLGKLQIEILEVE